MTLDTAKKIYIAAGGNASHDADEWAAVHLEMEAVVIAPDDQAAAKIIAWWNCWQGRYTAIAFARRVRKRFQKLQQRNPQPCPTS